MLAMEGAIDAMRNYYLNWWKVLSSITRHLKEFKC